MCVAECARNFPVKFIRRGSLDYLVCELWPECANSRAVLLILYPGISLFVTEKAKRVFLAESLKIQF